MQSRIALPAIFGLVVLSFVAATGFVHWEMGAIDRSALDIADASAPSIEHLAAARSDLRHLQLIMRREREREDRHDPFDSMAIEDSRHVVDRSIEEYLERPILDGERDSWDRVRRSREKLDAAIIQYEKDASAGKDMTAQRRELLAIFGEVGDATTASLEINAMHTRESALAIRTIRGRAGHVAIGLDVVCTLIAVLGVLLVRRIARAERELAERRRRVEEERATELEDFAGRIAHDILSPLGAIGFALDILRRTNDPAQRARVVDRGESAMGRIQRLVKGLLDFARAGGKPAANAFAEVETTIADLVAELEPTAAERNIELSTKQDGPLAVACNPGVLTSLVANLTRNAIKYLGDAPVRRIEIRAIEVGPRVRVEVEDTGPGLAPELERRVFDPYVRAADANTPGFGLGLATVKRLAEAHGGRVGVKSRPGHGSTFWFEIPNAAPPESQPRLTA